MKKLFIDSNQLLEDSFQLAWKVYESGFRPNYIVGVWRGGAPVGIAVQELLHQKGYTAREIRQSCKVVSNQNQVPKQFQDRYSTYDEYLEAISDYINGL